MRVNRGEYGAPPECKDGETGDSRGNPLTSGIVRYDSHLRKTESDPAGNPTQFAQDKAKKTRRNKTLGGEQLAICSALSSC
ncbi:hypothetical protein PR048_032076 [Dryococelus australis]|uniref:Uncharacterized protein n=1 Tax=Dryococelus australis TaxID=614101 RepID=A0ABQ9G4F7_9NEOP|nr:hypothetical protein PR048_032076 [Dryococelus australis]